MLCAGERQESGSFQLGGLEPWEDSQMWVRRNGLCSKLREGKRIHFQCCLCNFPCPITTGPSAGSRISNSKFISAAAVGNGVCVYPSLVAAFARFAMSSPATDTVAAAPSASQPLARPLPHPRVSRQSILSLNNSGVLGQLQRPWPGLLWKELTTSLRIQPFLFP